MKEAIERVEAEKKGESEAKKLGVGEMYDSLSHIPGFTDNIDRQQAEDMAGGIYFLNKFDCRNNTDAYVEKAKKNAKEKEVSPFYKKK